MTMVNNVIAVLNYVIAARPSLRNFMIADTQYDQTEFLKAAGAIRRSSTAIMASSWHEFLDLAIESTVTGSALRTPPLVGENLPGPVAND